MTIFTMKILLHPLFRAFFWSAATISLLWMGILEKGWIRWFHVLLAMILLDSAIKYAIMSVAYYRKSQLR